MYSALGVPLVVAVAVVKLPQQLIGLLDVVNYGLVQAQCSTGNASYISRASTMMEFLGAVIVTETLPLVYRVNEAYSIL